MPKADTDAIVLIFGYNVRERRIFHVEFVFLRNRIDNRGCLLYTSDAADERSSVDLGGRRIIKKKHTVHSDMTVCM